MPDLRLRRTAREIAKAACAAFGDPSATDSVSDRLCTADVDPAGPSGMIKPALLWQDRQPYLRHACIQTHYRILAMHSGLYLPGQQQRR
jgi:hypothetical protein